MKKHLLRKSEPSKLTYVGELLGGRNFSPKMVKIFLCKNGNVFIFLISTVDRLSDFFNRLKTCLHIHDSLYDSPRFTPISHGQKNREGSG